MRARSLIAGRDRVGAAGQPGDDGVGHGRLRHRARRLLRPRRRSARSSSSRSPPSSGPATRRRGCTRRRWDAQRRRAAGPGRRRTGSTTRCPTCSRTGATVVRQHLGPHGRRVPPRPPTCSPPPPPEVVAVEVNLSCPNLEGRRRDLRPRPRAVGRGDRRDRRLRAAALGQAQRQHRPHRRGRRRRPRGRRRGGDLHQHDARHGVRPRRRARRRSAPAAAGCRARRSTRSPCAPCTTSTPRCPSCRSSASAASPTGWDADELMLAGATPSRSARPRSPIPRAPLRILTTSYGTPAPGPGSIRHPPGQPCATVTAWQHLRS